MVWNESTLRSPDEAHSLRNRGLILGLIFALVLLSACTETPSDGAESTWIEEYRSLILAGGEHSYPSILPVDYQNPYGLVDKAVGVVLAQDHPDAVGREALFDLFREHLGQTNHFKPSDYHVTDQVVILQALSLVGEEQVWPDNVAPLIQGSMADQTIYELAAYNRIQRLLGNQPMDFSQEICERLPELEPEYPTSEIVMAVELSDDNLPKECELLLTEKVQNQLALYNKINNDDISAVFVAEAVHLVDHGLNVEHVPTRALAEAARLAVRDYLKSYPDAVIQYPKIYVRYRQSTGDKAFVVDVSLEALEQYGRFGNLTFTSDITDYYLFDLLLQITGAETWSQELAETVKPTKVREPDDLLKLMAMGHIRPHASLESFVDQVNMDRLSSQMAMAELVGKNPELCDGYFASRINLCDKKQVSLQERLGDLKLHELASAPEREAVSLTILSEILQACWLPSVKSELTEKTQDDLRNLGVAVRQGRPVGHVEFDLMVEVFSKPAEICDKISR